MEGTHRQLCTRLTDGLCRDDTNRLTDLYRLTGRHVCAVALCTDTDMGTTGQDRTNLDFLELLTVLIYAFLHDTSRTFRCNHVVGLYKDFSISVLDILAGETSCDTLLQTLDLFFSIRELLYIHTRNLALAAPAVHLTDNQIL